MDFIILAVLIALNGLFALSEMSLVASKKSRLAALAEGGDSRARDALELANDPNRILATTQLGLTFTTLVEGALGAQSLSFFFIERLPHWAWMEPWRDAAAQGATLALITFATLVFGEMLPKRAALVRPEAIACWMAPWAKGFTRAIWPLVSALSFCTNRLMALLGLPLVSSQAVCAEDVETMMEAAGQSGLLSEREMTIMDNVWRLDERKVGAIMTPRQDIKFLDLDNTHEENLDILVKNHRLRLVVTRGGLDCVLGMAPISQWTDHLVEQLSAGVRAPLIDWTADLTPAHGMPNSLTLIETLESFRTHKTHVGLVYNEFGQVEGIISISDLMDALVGEMPQSPGQDTLIFKDASGKWLIDGLASISDTKTALGLGSLPGESQANFQTAGGFALWMIGRSKGRLPKEFDEFNHEGMRFQIVDIDRKNGYRIDQIMVEPVAEPEPRPRDDEPTASSSV